MKGQPYGPKTTKRIEAALRANERNGPPSKSGGVGDVTFRQRERWGKACLDPDAGTMAWNLYPEGRMFPFELGHLDAERAFVGSGVRIEVFAADGPILENKVYVVRYMPGDSATQAPGIWTPVTFAVGHVSGVTVDTIAAGGTGTVNAEGLGEVELTNWSGRSVPSGKACRVNWNYIDHVWEILVATC